MHDLPVFRQMMCNSVFMLKVIFDSLDYKGISCRIDISVGIGYTFLLESFTKEVIMNTIEKFIFLGKVLFTGTLVGGLMLLEGWPHGGDNPN